MRAIYRKTTGEYLDTEQSWVKTLVVADALLVKARAKWGDDVEIREADTPWLKMVVGDKLVDDQVKISAIAAKAAKPRPPTLEERIVALEAKAVELK